VNLSGVLAPSDLPGARATVPGVAVRIGFVVAAALLLGLDFGFGGWLVIGILLAIAAAVAPQTMLGWAVILMLAIGRLQHSASLSWQLLVLMAGLHLLHVLAALMLELPWRSWVQPAVFRAPLLRFAALELPTQGVAVVVLLLLAPGHAGHRPVTAGGFALVGALALAVLAVALLVPRAGEQSGPGGDR
jgi:hypothetical protein